MGNRLDFLSPDELAALQTDVQDLFLEDQVTRTVTYYHLGADEPESYGSFGGTISRSAVPESLEMVRGHVRDSVSSEIIVGRYRYLARIADFAWAPPTPTGVMYDGSVQYQVNAVREDPVSLLYVLEVTVVED